MPQRKDRPFAGIVLSLLIMITLFSLICSFANDYGWGLLFALVALLIHCLAFMRSQPPHPAVTVVCAILQLVSLFNISVMNFIDTSTDEIDEAVIFAWVSVICALPAAVFYIQHIFTPKRSTAFVGMTWQESRAIQPQSLFQKKLELRAREKAYKRIAIYHEYLEKGIITQEEYEDNRRQILSTLKE